MKYIEAYNTGGRFWETFPLFKMKEPFRSLYKKDRSKDKHKTDKFMWLLVWCYDIDSEIYSIIEEDEKLSTAEEIADITIKEVVDDTFYMYATAFTDTIDTVLSANVRALEDKLKERQLFISNTNYTLDSTERDEETGKLVKIPGTAKDLDTMMANTGKIHNEVRTLRENLKESDTGEGKGGSEESFLERQ